MLLSQVIFSSLSRALLTSSADPDHEMNCVEMQSVQFNLLWQTYYCEDGYDLYAVCQLP